MATQTDSRVMTLPVVGYEGLYEVDSSGVVYSLNYNRTGKREKLKARVLPNGYLMVSLYKDRKRELLLVHHLIAEAFIPNPEGKPHIDHINTVRWDNRVENLRWCTCKENHHNPITEAAYREATKKRSQDPKWRRNTKIAGQKRSQDPKWRRNIIKALAKAVYCVELDKVFESTMEAARQLGLSSSNISSCCLGKRRITGGYHFQFSVKED